MNNLKKSSAINHTSVQWMTLTDQTVCVCSHGPRQDRPPTAKGGLAAWDSSAATLLLHFLLSLPSSVPRSHPHHPFLTLFLPHKSHRTVQIILYCKSTSIPFQPTPWTPYPTGPDCTSCHTVTCL